MSLTKEKSIDQITVCENGIILYRETTRIIENGVELSKSYHRTSLIPDQDITDVPENVKNICNVVWTPEIIAAYKQSSNVQYNTL